MRPTHRSSNAGCQLSNGAQCTPALHFSWLFVFVLSATAALGQYTTARLSGTVQDNSGAAVPGATVTVEQVGTGYKQQVKSGVASLPEGTEMVMPGDNVSLEIELITPVAMEKGLRFAIREGGRTVGAGTITEIIA